MLHTRQGLRSAVVLAAMLSAPAGAQPGNVPGTKQVVVDGHAMRVLAVGLETRKPGSPVIVFEAGAGQGLNVWRDVVPKLDGVGAIVAYDRGGLGQSVWDDKPPTPQHVAGKLHRLLQQVGASPPYVLVGYSWGGSLMRYFAGLYPTEIAGIVYVDPGPVITQSVADELAPFNAIGAGRKGYEAFWKTFEGLVSRGSPAVRAEFEVFRTLMQREPRHRELRPAPAVPVAMVLAAKPFPPFGGLPYDASAHFQADVRHRIRMLQEWVLASPQGTLVLSNTTTHAIPREDPDVIVWALRRVLTAVEKPAR